MERLTMDNVKAMGMYQLAHNHVFVKDGEAWYRDFDREVSVRDLAKEMFARNGIEYPTDTEEFDEFMLDLLQDGYETIDGMIAMYYLSLWSMADVREGLKVYEDTGLTPEEIVALQKTYNLRENCFKKMKSKYENLLKMYEAGCEGYMGLWKELQEYQNSDEPEFILITSQREASEKQTPKKPNRDCGGCYCPECNEWIDEMQVGIAKHCIECGQAFDWEGVKTDE